MRLSLSVTSLYVFIKSGPVCTSISDFYDINSNMEYQHLCGTCENDTAFYEVADDLTSKHTVNMTNCRNFAYKKQVFVRFTLFICVNLHGATDSTGLRTN